MKLNNLVLVFCFLSMIMFSSASAGNGPLAHKDFKVVTLSSVTVPNDVLREFAGRTNFATSKMYVEAKLNGRDIWRFPATAVNPDSLAETFIFDSTQDGMTLPLMLSANDSLCFRVCIAESEAEIRTGRAAVAGVGGALAGAAAGLVVGLSGGPFSVVTVPVGVITGGLVGMFVGGGSGALYPVDDERQIAICSDVRVGDLYEELLSDPIEGRYVLDGNRVRIKFSGEDAFEVVKGGDLALQGHYLVHLRTIKLNPHSPGVDPDGEYYAIFKQSGNPEVRVELGNITPGVEFPLEVMVLLDNKGGDSWFAVFCDKWGQTPLFLKHTKPRSMESVGYTRRLYVGWTVL